MGSPARGAWTNMATAAINVEFINPAGAIARLTTRSYGGNLGEYRTTHTWEALDIISRTDAPSGLTPDQFAALESRLQLNGRMFSGLVRDEALPHFYEKFQTARAEMRAHNWELLRQSAEDNGLCFQPFTLGRMSGAFAMILIARDDLPDDDEDPQRHFDAQFLKIADPYKNAALRRSTANKIPLALYSLDYPGVPLLLIDFQRPAAPKRAEMALRFADDLTVGVLGLTGFAHWDYLAAKASWMFIHKRHGAATDRALRRRAFVQLRHALGTDDTIDPALRARLTDRIGKLDLDPLDRPGSGSSCRARSIRSAPPQIPLICFTHAHACGTGGLAAGQRDASRAPQSHKC